MIRKTLVGLGLIFILQFSFSCLKCNCPKTHTYKVAYEESAIETHLDVFHNSDTEDSVSIFVSLYYDEQVASLAPLENNLPTFGFSSAIAMQPCDCASDILEIDDYADSVALLMKNGSYPPINIIQDFEWVGYDPNEAYKFIEKRKQNLNYHTIRFYQKKAIDYSDSVSFICEVYLKSGTKITSESEYLLF